MFFDVFWCVFNIRVKGLSSLSYDLTLLFLDLQAISHPRAIQGIGICLKMGEQKFQWICMDLPIKVR